MSGLTWHAAWWIRASPRELRHYVSMAVAALLLLLVRAPVADAAASSSAGTLLAAALAAPEQACPGLALNGQALWRLYSPASPTPLWIDEGGPGPRAHQLRAALERADDEGLPPARYGLPGIVAHWNASAPGELVCLELMLTAALERYARELAAGRVAPGEADPTWRLPPAAFDPVVALQAIFAGADVGEELGRLVPAQDLYRRLRVALARYRRLAERGGWHTSLTGPPLEAGHAGKRIAALRERLRREGDLAPPEPPSGRPFDAALTAAVRRFQRRHGLLDDGIVGPRTMAALNTSAAERVAQLRRAMERLRWMPRDLGPHYVLVNSAAFELTVVENDRSVLGMRVIVGALDQATPSFTATLRLLVINPYWNVPLRIVRDKLLPRERRSPGYLAAHGFRVLDARTGRWREASAAALADAQDSGSPLRLRQEPGPANLMGRLSFVFPNPYDVFLHDTPARSLFEREVRACSEGCVRIEQALALALHLLRRAPEWTGERIQREIDALRHRVLPLPEPVPVYVVYLPTWADDDGVVHFRPDHYGRESALSVHFPAR
jgi:murein L,D-transpeptidase YcbB/YkuD